MTSGLDCTCDRLRKLTRRVTQIYDWHLQPSGLRITQFSLLATLGAAKSVSVTELAEALGMDRTTLIRNLRPLERSGYLTVDAGSDRRSQKLNRKNARETLYHLQVQDAFRSEMIITVNQFPL
ncbi:MAG: MarR family transcriptional regulator [Chlorogloeopsis fritschii C42_A2020_084]|uniref:MarR family winged helix-turn-helix transcriptional regulator n=1 Tax=Chlorogloeopsis fritschii TaxID=1124 RepID=UPI001A0C75C4|nr:MarR family transcriptional regulator [Chlorogloeopsis fritschii]MBF2006109.1 MarR family transcriptional regulator [Chlorogloeopsis fritschii C42_A2020_084]